jgi:hypothetical protein
MIAHLGEPGQGDGLPPFRSVRLANRLECRQVFDARQITRVLAAGHLPDQAAEDLAAAGLGQLGHKPHLVGGKRLAQLQGDPVAQLVSERVGRLPTGFQDCETVDVFPFSVTQQRRSSSCMSTWCATSCAILTKMQRLWHAEPGSVRLSGNELCAPKTTARRMFVALEWGKEWPTRGFTTRSWSPSYR